MSIVGHVIQRGKLLLLESVNTSKQRIDLERPVFSFTFDDAPLSSACEGRQILESAGASGTYYLALGIQPTEHDCEPFVGHGDIRSLFSNGHDIQCHTYSHLNVGLSATCETVSDCERNRRAIMDITGQDLVSHFAYPFGVVRLAAKKALGEVYKTLRTVDFGINYGLTDMAHLRSIEIYSSRLDRRKICKAIEASVKNNAWTIFHTHGVRSEPGSWGVTPIDLGWVVKECAATGGDICSVSEAYQKIHQL